MLYFIGFFAVLLFVFFMVWRTSQLEKYSREEKFGHPNNPHPIKTNVSVGETLKKIEQGLAECSYKEFSWSIRKLDIEAGLLVANSYAYYTGPSRSYEFPVLHNFILLEAHVTPDANGGSQVSWHYSVTAKNSAQVDITGPWTELEETKILIEQANEMIRELTK